jgi:hypothetical protein
MEHFSRLPAPYFLILSYLKIITGLASKKGFGCGVNKAVNMMNFQQQTQCHENRLEIKRLLIVQYEIRRIAKALNDLTHLVAEPHA